MKKTKSILCSFLFAIIVLTGCAANASPDAYIAESDYQYKQSYNNALPKLQQGDDAVYFFHNGFIYYLEDGSDVIMPLCNKADCLHDQETDTEKWKECNAHVDAYVENIPVWTDYMGITKCNASIYCLSPALFLHTPQALYRFALDGTEKEVVYAWNSEESAVTEWMIHRDVLCYMEQRYYLKDNEKMVEYSVKSLALTGINRKPETIYTADENLSVLSLNQPHAYGNYVYFDIMSIRRSEEEATEEDIYDRLYYRTFVYNIQTKELKELEIPGLSKAASILGVQFWQDKIIMDPYDNEKEGNAPMPVYIAELDGSNPEVLLEDVPQGSFFESDGEYLYLVDDWMPDLDDWLDNPGTYTVYDKEMNIVDTFTAPRMPNGKAERLPAGERDRMYYVYEDEENGTWGVLRWDKDIGSYQGGSFSMTEIPYQE